MSNFNPQFQRIGDILVHNKAISQEDLDKALAEQKTSKDKLGHILIKFGYITEDDLINAYSQQMGYKTIDFEDILKANLEVTALLSEEFAREKNIIALNKSSNSIIIVMEDPEDLSTLDAVKKLTKLNPEIFISSNSSIIKALDILYGKIKKSGEVEKLLIHYVHETEHSLIDAALYPYFSYEKRFRFCARADFVSDTTLWELKCTSKITFEHRMQVVIYAWLWRTLYPESPRKTQVYNLRTGEKMRLDASDADLTRIMVSLLRGKYEEPVVLSDEEFIEQCTNIIEMK